MLSWFVIASDYEKEKRWADQVIDALFDGEPVYLTANEHEILALYTEPVDQSKTGIVLMHGTGVHPDWPMVINPLRVALAEEGFHTLSIQMPILENEADQQDYVALFPQVPARIDAAIEYFSNKGVAKIYLIGHSLGAAMGTYYLRDGNRNFEGFIAIGLSSGIADSDMDNHANLSTVQIPTLDLYGSEDLENVVENAKARKKAADNIENYKQFQIEGADHFFDGEEEILLERVLSWLESY